MRDVDYVDHYTIFKDTILTMVSTFADVVILYHLPYQSIYENDQKDVINDHVHLVLGLVSNPSFHAMDTEEFL